MSAPDADATPVCPCGMFVHPSVISNPPGLNAIAYRAGDYTAFRHALLMARAGETELSRTDGSRIVQVWRPGGKGDLAVQMIEWWAYLADVLTFYNERVANQAYLRTAELPESVSRLIRLLGYRPRPGLGATGVLAALANGPKPFTLKAGFQVQSKPGPGQLPQVFELTKDTPVGALATGPGTAPQGDMPAAPTPDPASKQVQSGNIVMVQGAVSSVKQGDRLLFLGNGASPVWAYATVLALISQRDPQLGAVTQIQFHPEDDLSAVTDVTQFRLLKSTQSTSVWQYPAAAGDVVRTDSTQTNGTVDLQTIVRGTQIGDPILFELPSAGSTAKTANVQLASVVSTSEAVWYANPKGYVPGSSAS